MNRMLGKYNTTLNGENAIKNAKSVPEVLTILREYYDSFYFKSDRANQSTNYAKMNLLFLASVNRVEELVGDDK